jgi:hypothetical protein
MKKQYSSEQVYNKCVSAKNKVLLALQVAKIPGLMQEKQGIRIQNISSRLYLYGSRPPKYMEELLTYHKMHMMRKEWLDKLYPYFEPFIDGITKKQMWHAIKDQRLRYRNNWDIMERRIANRGERLCREEPQERFIDIAGEEHADRYPRSRNIGTQRIYPMLSHRYVEFILSLSRNRVRQLQERFILDVNGYDLNYGSVKDLEIKLFVDSSEREAITDKIAICDNVYSYGFGEDFRIIIAKGRLHIHDAPNYDFVVRQGYVTQDGLRRIKHGRE